MLTSWSWLLRWGVALIGLSCGWVYLLVSLFLRTRNTGNLLRDGSAFLPFLVFAWLAVGLPLAVWNPRLTTGGRVLLALVVCGFAGFLIMVPFFGVLGAFAFSAIWVFPVTTIAMLIYVVIVGKLNR